MQQSHCNHFKVTLVLNVFMVPFHDRIWREKIDILTTGIFVKARIDSTVSFSLVDTCVDWMSMHLSTRPVFHAGIFNNTGHVNSLVNFCK